MTKLESQALEAVKLAAGKVVEPPSWWKTNLTLKKR